MNCASAWWRVGLWLFLMTGPGMTMAVETYQQARELLPRIYAELDQPQTIYCGCPLRFSPDGRQYFLDRKCAYIDDPEARDNRGRRVEVEHVVPASRFGQQRPCWQRGGRRLCQRVDGDFSEMEGDLHNLFPSVGAVNAARGNYRFSDWVGAEAGFRGCDIAIDHKHRQVRPPEHARGKIARAYLYMAEKYGLKLSRAQHELFKVWSAHYRPSANECRRNLLIAKVQGNENHFISEMCHSGRD